jgi:hypothetical protein
MKLQLNTLMIFFFICLPIFVAAEPDWKIKKNNPIKDIEKVLSEYAKSNKKDTPLSTQYMRTFILSFELSPNCSPEQLREAKNRHPKPKTYRMEEARISTTSVLLGKGYLISGGSPKTGMPK